MINQVITNIQNDLLGILDEDQMKLLSEVLAKHLLPLQSATTESKNEKSDMLPVFIAAKRVEGCSEKSLRYYESTIRNMLECIGKPECQIMLYHAAISMAKSMLEKGLITEEEYAEIDTILLEKYRPYLGTLLSENA